MTTSINGYPLREPIAALTPVTPPPPVVSFGEMLAHSRIDGEAERALVEGYVAAATQHLDAKFGILAGFSLGVQTWELHLDAFPCGPILIPLSPLVDVLSVSYVDVDGFGQTISPLNYAVDDKSRDGWVVPIAGFAWPPTLAAINVVTVRFRAGNSTVPELLKFAVMELAAHFYENREATTPATLSEIPIGVYDLVGPYRRIFV